MSRLSRSSQAVASSRRLIVAVAVLGVLSACDDDPTPSPAVVIQPSTAQVYQGATLHFSATGVEVAWSVQQGNSGGSITSAGMYTAPKAAGTFHILATARSDRNRIATAAVTVPTIRLSIYPTSDVLRREGIRAMDGGVTASGQTIDWSVMEGPAGGSLSDGPWRGPSYVAPNGIGTFHVLARYRADPTITATATFTVVDTGFKPIPMTTQDERYEHTATLLANGKIPSVGGDTCAYHDEFGNCPTTSASLYDPATNQLASAGSALEPRAFHTATRLTSGKVLIAGGGSAVAEIHDPVSGLFAATGSMSGRRADHTATLLADGKVLFAGGRMGNISSTASAEIYDPQVGTFSGVGDMVSARADHTATRLANGQVLITGGYTAGYSGRSATAELHDPGARTFSASANMNEARAGHAATLLSNGNVLIGGSGNQQELSG